MSLDDLHTHWLSPPQPVPPGVVAGMSLRSGGASLAPFDRWNLRPPLWNAALQSGEADDPRHIAENQRRLQRRLGLVPYYVRQEHGAQVHRLHPGATPEDPDRVGDAAWTTHPGMACTVLVADCLPVLFWDTDGTVVGAAHVGWRGLAAGVLEATVEAMVQGSGVQVQALSVWLAPCIGPDAFEVGAEVLEGLGLPHDARHSAVRWTPRPDGAPRWHLDLQALARERLHRLGVQTCLVTRRCTVADASAFFSFRRDGRTGRMAAAIGLLPGEPCLATHGGP